MYRVFLIDDEPWAMVSLERLVDWQSLGFRVEAKLDNARTAWERIRRDMPDLIITDIRMPGLSGLELLGRIHEENLAVEVVLVSAFADFSYAQEAIGKGAAEYLLKPVPREKLTECIRKIAGRLNQRRMHRNRWEAAAGREALMQSATLREAFGRLKQTPPPEAQMAVINLRESPDGELAQALTEVCDWVCVDMGNEEVFCLCAAADAQALQETLKRVCAAESGVYGMAFEAPGGEPPEKLNWQARTARHTARFIGRPGLRAETGDAGGVREVELYRAVQYNQRSVLVEGLQQLRRAVCEGQVMLDRLFTLLQGLDRFCVELQGMEPLFPATWKRYADMTEDYPGADELFDRLCAQLAERPEEAWLEVVLREAEMHYAHPKTLQALSVELGVSQAGLSQMVKRHTGRTYSELIQEKRMEKACELLKYTDQMVSDIAYRVGYSDQFYFSKLFKRLCGMSPNAYRKKDPTG